MIEILSKPWAWYVAGPTIALVMLVLLLFGKTFGVSSNFRTMCAIAGAGKRVSFFDYDWRSKVWNLVVLAGVAIGGFIASHWLNDGSTMNIASSTVAQLNELGFNNVGKSYVPAELFGSEAIASVGGIFFLLLGGFFVGFGARYAGGCTSGHGISGLSNLQLPSLIAIIGFFIGGLTMVHFIFPIIFK